MQFQGVTNLTANTPRQLYQRNGAGTITLTVSNNTITGTGTAFTTDFRVGDYLQANGQTFKIEFIDSNTSISVDIQPTASVSNTAYTWQPAMSKTGKIDTIEIINRATSTPIFVGTSTNALKDGSDISITSRSVIIPAGKSRLFREVNYQEVYTISANASIPFDINQFA
jgi:hypothetical protein